MCQKQANGWLSWVVICAFNMDIYRQDDVALPKKHVCMYNSYCSHIPLTNGQSDV